MPHVMLKTYEVEAGNILFTGTSAFKVEEVREPSHPLFPGLVFEGYYFDTKRGVWGRKTTLSAEYGAKWREYDFPFPDAHFSAYLRKGDPAVVRDYSNGSSVWSQEVKCKVVEFGELTSRVRVTGDSWQFVKHTTVEVPSQRLYRRKDSK
ncbi:hypothetical protein ACFYY2_12095 [Streptomyces sp. NPDC001822]|uniref:hypothetical protein n=1 Tax=Streptomyces sp. NPDC001822 TaxID=3364614 RepID=UPI00369293D7